MSREISSDVDFYRQVKGFVSMAVIAGILGYGVLNRSNMEEESGNDGYASSPSIVPSVIFGGSDCAPEPYYVPVANLAYENTNFGATPIPTAGEIFGPPIPEGIVQASSTSTSTSTC